jgi:eukaryotic-like serine/threonine-protein kinase
VALDRGTLLGHYEITALIGRGGMGEVYKARDTRLGRFVAIKVINPELADRADAQRRFEEECRVTATLDHPRICAVHDVGRAGSLLYLVMEFLEGQSLHAKLAHGPLARSEVLGYAIEIADAVDYAHRRGVIHRDLKPANVFITPSGVKVLDFGLAKLRQADMLPTSDVAGEVTAPARTTDVFVSGTPYYLPPERLDGMPADQRSDVYGFGAILYEMAARRRPFEGSSSATVIAAILTTDPPPVPPDSTASDVEWIVRRCLCKNPEDRWQSLGDVSATLKWTARASGGLTASSGAATRQARAPRLVAAGLLIPAVLAVAFLVRPRRAESVKLPVAASVLPPPGGAFTGTQSSVDAAQLALSPDGRQLAFVASGASGVSQIWVRPIDAIDATALPGTEGATWPFWSPDGNTLGFFAAGQLQRIDRRGGPAQVLAPAPSGRGGTWNADDVILFAPETNGPLKRVKVEAAGSTSVDDIPLAMAAGDLDHRWPQFLPDGRHFLFFVRNGDPKTEGIYLAALDSSERTLLVNSTSSGQYAPPGRLLYVVEGTLLSRKLDLGRRRLIGEPTVIATRVGTSSNFSAAVSVSTDGTIAYGSRAAADALTWFDRNGNKLDTAANSARYVDFRISPDGRRVAISAVDPHTDRPDVNILDLARPTLTRVTTSNETDASPVWAPDGTRLVFRSNRRGTQDLYISPSAYGGGDRLFFESSSAKYPTDWSRSGLVVYQTNNANNEGRTGWDIFAVPVGHPTDTFPLTNTRFNEAQGQVSPDERWLAYTSDESGVPEVYVGPLAGPGEKPSELHGRMVSTHAAADAGWRGASDPRWRADGRELFYVTADGTLMAVPLSLRGGVLDFGAARRLFEIGASPIAPPYMSEYDAIPDGSRFLVRVRSRALPLTVLLNWPAN